MIITRDTLHRNVERNRHEGKTIDRKRLQFCRELLSRNNALGLVQYHDKNGCTPLHKACWYNFPLDIIKSMCHLDPTLSTKRSSTDGSTPLHRACARASEDVVNFILATGTHAVSIPNRQNRLPLHDVIDGRRSPKLIKNILLTYPTAIYYVDRYKRTPLKHFFHKWLMEANLVGILKDVKFGAEARVKVKETLSLLVQAHVYGTVDDTDPRLQKWLALHETLKVKMPKMFRLILIREMPEELTKLDDYGNFPFHIECSGPPRFN